MPFQEVKGNSELRNLVVHLQDNGSDYFHGIELITAVLNGRNPNWKVYVYVKDGGSMKNDNSCDDDSSDNVNDEIYYPCQGVFCADISSQIRYYALCCKEVPGERIITELKDKLDWTKQFVFYHSYVEYTPLIQQLCNGKAVELRESFFRVLCSTEKLPEIPEDNVGRDDQGQFQIRKIGENFARIISEQWKRGTRGNQEVVEEELRQGYGYGIFVDGHIVSWIIMKKHCTMGNVFTLSNFRRRGFASIVISALSRDILSQGRTPFVRVDIANTASNGLFESLGFVKVQKVCHACWIPQIEDV